MTTYNGECFCGAVRSKSRASRKLWGIVTADHADHGPADRSMLSRFGSPMRCGSLPVRSMLACIKRRQRVSANTAKNAEVI